MSCVVVGAVSSAGATFATAGGAGDVRFGMGKGGATNAHLPPGETYSFMKVITVT